MKYRYATYYYALGNDPEPQFEAQGRCKTLGTAVRTAMYRVYEAQYAKSLIVDQRTGAVAHNITKHESGGYRVNLGITGFMPGVSHLRRVV